jgi:alcohol sulfotransferase
MYADTLLCSHPRSGGRWLRYLIAHYLAARHRLDIAVTPKTVFTVVPDHHHTGTRGYPAFQFRDRHDLPLLGVCHQPYSWELHRGFPIFFLARNPYDVVVSAYYHLTQAKVEYTGSRRDFTQHTRLGLPAWIEYMNVWAPQLLLHRDSVLLSYRELDTDPARALTRALGFLHEAPDPVLVQAAVESGNALRSARDIRTGQEGNFWDHLEPDEIFNIQEILHRDLSVFAVHLLESIGMEVDPFPRETA